MQARRRCKEKETEKGNLYADKILRLQTTKNVKR